MKFAEIIKVIVSCRMEATKVTDEGKKKLQEICDSINSGRDTENKLDLNYKHHSQVMQKRNSTNYL